LGHEVLNRSGDVLNWDFRVDTVLVEQVDAVCAKALEHPLDHALDMIGLAVEPGTALPRLLVDVPAELGRDLDLISKGATPSPRMRSTSNGPYASAASKKVTPRSKAARMMLIISGRYGTVVSYLRLMF
jgi:hypothetical protein